MKTKKLKIKRKQKRTTILIWSKQLNITIKEIHFVIGFFSPNTNLFYS